MFEALAADFAIKSLSPGSSTAGAGGIPLKSSAGPRSDAVSGTGPATLYGGNITFNKGAGWPMWAALAIASVAAVWLLKR